MLMLIDQSTAAGTAVINVGQKHIGSAIRVVGTISNDIPIEYPLVDIPDIGDDTHWASITMDNNDVVLGAANTMWVIAGVLGPIRINKPAGDNVGIKHVW